MAFRASGSKGSQSLTLVRMVKLVVAKVSTVKAASNMPMTIIPTKHATPTLSRITIACSSVLMRLRPRASFCCGALAGLAAVALRIISSLMLCAFTVLPRICNFCSAVCAAGTKSHSTR